MCIVKFVIITQLKRNDDAFNKIKNDDISRCFERKLKMAKKTRRFESRRRLHRKNESP